VRGLLGAGGMGEVYGTHNTHLGRDPAGVMNLNLNTLAVTPDARGYAL
jgi:hypothetical protein